MSIRSTVTEALMLWLSIRQALGRLAAFDFADLAAEKVGELVKDPTASQRAEVGLTRAASPLDCGALCRGKRMDEMPRTSSSRPWLSGMSAPATPDDSRSPSWSVTG
ncbi:hypothetical protein [Streptomyces sp. AM 2-1-1]|uniref:hypothetical protein n=1 Tax=Streptomyces sp. AM 2-1-1 TaxID=3028709 RepID=UPI0023B8B030|nr:hypothetical protein [Streptomyces sp. AM 2-1-1]WEH40024.1 hypothetical protein PZB77_11145 [Streptomyces sp. AM 2-1-1]